MHKLPVTASPGVHRCHLSTVKTMRRAHLNDCLSSSPFIITAALSASSPPPPAAGIRCELVAASVALTADVPT